MSFKINKIERVLVLSWLSLLAGCSFIGDTVKSEMSSYAEPKDGSLAYIRLIGSRNVKVYPNSICTSFNVPGSGYPAGPQMGGQRKRDIGMPKTAGMPKHFVEIAARADEPIAVRFSFHRETISPGIAGTGMPNSRSSASCTSAKAFTPKSGENYEAIANGLTGDCTIEIVRLEREADEGPWRKIPVSGVAASGCIEN